MDRDLFWGYPHCVIPRLTTHWDACASSTSFCKLASFCLTPRWSGRRHGAISWSKELSGAAQLATVRRMEGPSSIMGARIGSIPSRGNAPESFLARYGVIAVAI